MIEEYLGKWSVNNATGFRSVMAPRKGLKREDPHLNFAFVGVGYTLNGVSRWINGTGVGEPLSLNRVRIPTRSYKFVKEWMDDSDHNLGSASNLNLSVYTVEASFSNTTDVTVHNFTVEVPIRTQAYVLQPLDLVANGEAIVR